MPVITEVPIRTPMAVMVIEPGTMLPTIANDSLKEIKNVKMPAQCGCWPSQLVRGAMYIK